MHFIQILFFLLVPVTVGTVVNVEFYLKCKSKQTWWYAYEVWEYDSWTYNDIVVGKSNKLTWVNGEAILRTSFEYEKGDGWRDEFYEFFFEFTHNCGNYTQKHVKSRIEEKTTRLYLTTIPIEADEFNTTISTFMDVFGVWKKRPKMPNSETSPYRTTESDENE